jgi:hypothetical protein
MFQPGAARADVRERGHPVPRVRRSYRAKERFTPWRILFDTLGATEEGMTVTCCRADEITRVYERDRRFVDRLGPLTAKRHVDHDAVRAVSIRRIGQNRANAAHNELATSASAIILSLRNYF